MRSCDAAFKNEVRLRCYEALQREGFTRYRKESVDWPLSDEFSFWLGLNTALLASYVEINPFIGIHATVMAKLVSAIRREGGLLPMSGSYGLRYRPKSSRRLLGSQVCA
jgi:hypothetical protein